jgi:hypothetical protein
MQDCAAAYVLSYLTLRNGSQLACNSRYIASGRPQQKTPFPNNYSVVIEICLPHRCI